MKLFKNLWLNGLYLAVACAMPFSTQAQGWVPINGNVQLADGTPVCAMVLANGQYMFSCDGTGYYSLYVPLDENGQIELFSFADGFAPFKITLGPSSFPYAVGMQSAGSGTFGNLIANFSESTTFEGRSTNSGPFRTDSTDLTISEDGSGIRIELARFFDSTCLLTGNVNAERTSASGEYQCSDFTTGLWSSSLIRLEYGVLTASFVLQQDGFEPYNLTFGGL